LPTSFPFAYRDMIPTEQPMKTHIEGCASDGGSGLTYAVLPVASCRRGGGLTEPCKEAMHGPVTQESR
jgi:hypothetical protein